MMHYSGDGEITEVKMHSMLVRDGYQVQFKPVKLDQQVHLTYHFSGLPEIKDRTVDIFFSIEDPRSWEDRGLYEWYQTNVSVAERESYKIASLDDLKATLSMSLKNKQGDTIFQFNRKLSECVWSRTERGSYSLYDRDFKTSFVPNKGEEYILELSMDFEPILKKDQAHVWMRCGGYW